MYKILGHLLYYVFYFDQEQQVPTDVADLTIPLDVAGDSYRIVLIPRDDTRPPRIANFSSTACVETTGKLINSFLFV